MAEERKKIAVIGLGIIGGSMAMALRGFLDAEIWGYDISEETCQKALDAKAVHKIGSSCGETIQDADLVILCVYPEGILNVLKENRAQLKDGAVVTEVCGVKTSIADQITEILPKGVSYVGSHPMAGKETEGFDSASAELFWMTGFIITPTKTSSPESIALIHEMAKFIGATRITLATPEEHDAVIAYTSDLMHIAASALCLSYQEDMNRAYTAGAFRDCTRIALINPQLWTELFLANADHVSAEIDRLQDSLSKFQKAISERDEKSLKQLLETVRSHKKIMQEKEPTPISAKEIEEWKHCM